MFWVKTISVFTWILAVDCTIPSYIKVCSKNDPHIDVCIKESISYLRPQLASGIPELDVPSLEPLVIDHFQVNSGRDQARINLGVNDVKIWGASKFDITEVKVDEAQLSFFVKVLIPHLYFEATYDLDMQMLVLSYKGKGPMSGNLTDMVLTFQLNGEIINKNGVQYLHFPRVKNGMTLGKIEMSFGDEKFKSEVLGKGINQVLMENGDMIAEQFAPGLAEACEGLFTDIGNHITEAFPYEELFPL
ncbi:putative beta-carotene-binding protein [Cylas formicarius]|uniref:putative beta-carotene-binding protein n=1 Tax=Cylas formicarius TaxID=197179 RepID=UPI002958DE5B|nr:putative beta-carotene-binding protein [Cylas formicarius]